MVRGQRVEGQGAEGCGGGTALSELDPEAARQ